jgi:hypothetical protein
MDIINNKIFLISFIYFVAKYIIKYFSRNKKIKYSFQQVDKKNGSLIKYIQEKNETKNNCNIIYKCEKNYDTDNFEMNIDEISNKKLVINNKKYEISFGYAKLYFYHNKCCNFGDKIININSENKENINEFVKNYHECTSKITDKKIVTPFPILFCVELSDALSGRICYDYNKNKSKLFGVMFKQIQYNYNKDKSTLFLTQNNEKIFNKIIEEKEKNFNILLCGSGTGKSATASAIIHHLNYYVYYVEEKTYENKYILPGTTYINLYDNLNFKNQNTYKIILNKIAENKDKINIVICRDIPDKLLDSVNFKYTIYYDKCDEYQYKNIKKYTGFKNDFDYRNMEIYEIIRKCYE